jgi:hypothetical protein
MNWKKYALGLALFGLYYVVWRNIENRVSFVRALTTAGQ